MAAALRRHAHATIDVSDGLAGDLAKLCRVSGVGAEIAVADVPLSPAARQALAADPGLIETILTGGDDFEVIAAVAPDHVAALRSEAATLGIATCVIGEVVAGPGGARFRTADGGMLSFEHPAYSHF
jgi:thiamine-monophosphate kinase